MTRPAIRRPVLAATACIAVLVAGPGAPALGPVPLAVGPAASAGPAQEAAPTRTQWFIAARAALDDALEVQMPFIDVGAAASDSGEPVAFSFKAYRGQTLEVTLVRDPAAPPDTHVYVELFRVVDVLGQSLHERLTALRPSASSLRSRLPSDGKYRVLVQAEGSAAGSYRVTFELAAALPFPVVGAQQDAIRSLFGASRDDGARAHAGIDIFVKRLTPVLAVATGRAMPHQDALGGNTVWLNTPGTSYYYAHLERVAVRDQQLVAAGDVLGYVGNSGNARNMAPHLHFGVYRWGYEPIDPLPLLVGRRLPLSERSAAVAAVDAGG